MKGGEPSEKMLDDIVQGCFRTKCKEDGRLAVHLDKVAKVGWLVKTGNNMIGEDLTQDNGFSNYKSLSLTYSYQSKDYIRLSQPQTACSLY